MHFCRKQHAFAPGLRCDTITKNVYPGAAAMEYIMQRKQDGNTCGAFVLAYYQWEKAGVKRCKRRLAGPMWNSCAGKLCSAVTMPGFETYSNPVLMMRWLAQQGARPVFYLGENPLVQKMFAVRCRPRQGQKLPRCRRRGCFAAKRWTFAVQGIFGASVPDGRGRRACGQASLCADEKAGGGHAAYCKPVARAGAAGRRGGRSPAPFLSRACCGRARPSAF